MTNFQQYNKYLNFSHASRMSTQKIKSYIKNQSTVEQCKSDILKRMQKIKQKIDLIENQEKKIMKESRGGSENVQKNQEGEISSFVTKFKKDLKYVLSQFDLFKDVITKLEKQNYQKHELGKQILIKTIRQQMRRFQGLIPSQIQQQMMKSKIRNALARSKHSNSLSESANESEKQQQKQEKAKIEITKASQHENKLDTTTDQISVTQNIQILQQIREFLLFEEIPKPQQQQELQQQRQKSIFISEIVAPEEYQEQEKLEKKRYFTFIQKERLKAQRTPAKIAGKVLLGICVAALIFLLLASFVVYRVVKSIAGEL